jgi:AraC family transcriptional regulator
VVHPAGDVCSYVELSPELLDDIFAQRPNAAGILQTGRARLSPQAWMAYQLALTRARRGEVTDPAVVENLIADILGAADVAPEPPPAASGPGASRTRRRVRDTVNAACQLLGLHLGDRLQLDDVAEAVNVSPFHLIRLFREVTGTTPHSYREQLRLRTACALLAEPDARLTDIAQRTGFFSHSHLTTRFTRSFGMSPSTAREMMHAQITQ